LARWWRGHAWAAAALTLGAAVAGGAWHGVALPTQAAVLAVAVSVAGVPHGALDTWVGRMTFAPRLGRWWAVWFHAAYLGLAALVVVLWLAAPTVALAAFLLVSALHFGTGDVEPALAPPGGRWGEVLARGALPIVGPAAAFPDEVTRLFAWVAPGGGGGPAAVAGALAWSGPRLLVPALAVVVASHAARAARRGGAHRAAHAAAAAEVLTLGLLFAAVPPLPAFVVYFCGWHAARHTLHLAAWIEPAHAGRALARLARMAAPATLLTVLGGAAAWLLLRPTAGDAPAAVRTVFVLLSALTVPHVLANAAAPPAGRLVASQTTSGLAR
jgi:Brp/Blh family beta-carotene 15,15'-monooxygenase